MKVYWVSISLKIAHPYLIHVSGGINNSTFDYQRGLPTTNLA
jgi:cAMP phosphodiesterase